MHRPPRLVIGAIELTSISPPYSPPPLHPPTVKNCCDLRVAVIPVKSIGDDYAYFNEEPMSSYQTVMWRRHCSNSFARSDFDRCTPLIESIGDTIRGRKKNTISRDMFKLGVTEDVRTRTRTFTIMIPHAINPQPPPTPSVLSAPLYPPPPRKHTGLLLPLHV